MWTTILLGTAIVWVAFQGYCLHRDSRNMKQLKDYFIFHKH